MAALPGGMVDVFARARKLTAGKGNGAAR
jgi:hypothetical protein